MVDRSIIGPDVFIDVGPRSPTRSSSLVSASGPGARLHRCVIDKNVAMPAGQPIGIDDGEDRDQFAISDAGIVVVAKEQQLG